MTESTTMVSTAYGGFTRNSRRLIAAELAGGEYPEISYNRVSKQVSKGPVSAYRAYLHILARPPDMEHTGQRNLDLGHLEIAVIIQAPLNNASSYTEGFEVGAVDKPLRLCIGANFGAFEDLTDRMIEIWRDIKPTLIENLNCTDYSAFVKRLLIMVNDSISEFKLSAPQRILDSHIMGEHVMY